MANVSQASPLTPARRRAQELAASGDLAGARAILEKAVELGKVNLAEDDPDVLVTAYHLGQLYRRMDDQPAARRVLEEAYAAGQWRLGDHDALMVEISYDIGVVAEELGNRHEARKAFTRVAQYGPAALGATHEAVARAQAYLGHAPDSVRSSAPPTATPAAPGSAAEPHLTLITPVPSALPFGTEPTVVGTPDPRPTAVAPAPADPVRVAPVTPFPRRSAEGLDEPTVIHSVITPRDIPPGPPQAPAHHLLAGPGPIAPGMAHPGVGPSAVDVAYRKRGLGLFAAIAAVMASLIAVVALVFVLADRDSGSAPASNVPTLAGRPPTDLTLHDLGSEVDVRWTDPSPGQVSFIVVMGHPGEQLKPLPALGPGTTSYRAAGLNPKLNYCFAVAAVYSATTFATSTQRCTSRGSADPGSSTGK
jgi:hypothetical protein